MKRSQIPLKEMETFGDLVKFLRRRARISQRELSIATGYSESHLSRLESNQRTPDRSSLLALFVPALQIEDEPEIIQKLLELAELDQPKNPVTKLDFQQEIPSLSSQADSHNHLPVQLTSFIGRAMELEELSRLLSGPQTRLVTLTGEGGCGKTRLALRVGENMVQDFDHGVWFVDLGILIDGEHLVDAVFSAFNLIPRDGGPILNDLIYYLKSRHILLILDNCEHLVDASAKFVTSILGECPRLHILATSRETLRVNGETTYRVMPLSLPPIQYGVNLDFTTALGYESIQLFVERGHSFQRGFNLSSQNVSAVTRICLRLDGIPLAIELAAARLNILHPEQIANRLEDDLDLLVNSTRTPGLRHHQTLHTAIDWSYNLLDDSERNLLRHLSVLVNGWGLDAVEWIVNHNKIPQKDGLHLLTNLVNKSLIRLTLAGEAEVRYQMLETIRSYLQKKLVENSEEQQARNNHLDYCIDLSLQADSSIKGSKQIQWFNRLNQEQENFRNALSWCAESENLEKGMQLAANLGHFWWMSGKYSEGIHWYTTFLKAIESIPSLSCDSYTAKALSYYGLLLALSGDVPIAFIHWEEGLSIYQELGDNAGCGMVLCLIGSFQEDLAKGVEISKQGLKYCLQAEDSWWIAETLH